MKAGVVLRVEDRGDVAEGRGEVTRACMDRLSGTAAGLAASPRREESELEGRDEKEP